MSEIVEHMKFISRFFPKGDDPLKFPDCDGSVATDECDVVSVKFISVGLVERIRPLVHYIYPTDVLKNLT